MKHTALKSDAKNYPQKYIALSHSSAMSVPAKTTGIILALQKVASVYICNN